MRNVLGKMVKIAVFKDIDPSSLICGYESIYTEEHEKVTSDVRISEYVEVEFSKLQDEIVIDRYIDALDRSERKVRLEFQRKLDEIATQRSNLMALAYFPAKS
jgi:hypothetical protein